MLHAGSGSIYLWTGLIRTSPIGSDDRHYNTPLQRNSCVKSLPGSIATCDQGSIGARGVMMCSFGDACDKKITNDFGKQKIPRTSPRGYFPPSRVLIVWRQKINRQTILLT